MYEQVTGMRLEGVVAKKADSPYRAGRSTSWYKIRAVSTDDFVVVGYTDPKGGRPAFGALHLAQYLDGELTYAGSVGTGFDDDQLGEIRGIIDEMETTRAEPARAGADLEAPTLGGAVPRGPSHHWITPDLVAEVRFKEFTDGGVIRHPSFVRIRDDKRPEDCVGELTAPGPEGGVPDPVPVTDHSVERTVQFTNLDKVFWPDEGYTKGDLIEYYRVVWP
jgi:bifunctional non-homologous end joining protein LigD